MTQERRSHPRLKTRKIQADIQSLHTEDSETSLTGDILDISQTGIRIKLSQPLGIDINDKLKITMVLPESGTPITVNGMLKHLHSDTEYGLHYTDHVDGSVDDMMFECFKLNDSTLLIKSI